MKKTLSKILAAAAILSSCIGSYAQENSSGFPEEDDIFVAGLTDLYIVPLTAEGKLPVKTGVSYEGEIQMNKTGTEEVFKADAVAINNGGNGFVFYGYNGKAGCLYYLSSKMSPNVLSVPYSQLSISGKPVKVPDGTYDITFVGRNVVGQGYHVFSIRQPGDNDDYPAELYVVSSEGGVQAIPEDSSSAGIYKSEIVMPQEFRIAYEQEVADPYFIYGPVDTSESLLKPGIAVNIAVNTNADTYFSGDTESKVSLEPGKSVYITVDLSSGSEATVMLENKILTSVYNPESSLRDKVSSVYDLSGISHGKFIPAKSGIYIIRYSDGETRKVIRL